MNVENLRIRYPELIAYMESEGYHENYIYKVEREVKRILAGATHGWVSYSDVYQGYASRSKSQHYLRQKRTILGLIEHFDVLGLYPDSLRRHKIVERAKYYRLNNEFKSVIDYYCDVEKKRGKKDSTIYGESSNAAAFLYALMEKGFETLQSITEDAILSEFIGAGGRLSRSNSNKKNIVAVLNACIPQDPETFERILSYFPVLRETRKNIQYLQPEEIAALKKVLEDANSTLSHRDKAICIMALNTGLRCCDIAGITLASIN